MEPFVQIVSRVMWLNLSYNVKDYSEECVWSVYFLSSSQSLPYVCGTKSIIYYISIQLRIKVWKKSMRLKNSEVKNWRPVVPIKSEHNEKSEYNPLINLIYWLHYTYSWAWLTGDLLLRTTTLRACLPWHITSWWASHGNKPQIHIRNLSNIQW